MYSKEEEAEPRTATEQLGRKPPKTPTPAKPPTATILYSPGKILVEECPSAAPPPLNTALKKTTLSVNNPSSTKPLLPWMNTSSAGAPSWGIWVSRGRCSRGRRGDYILWGRRWGLVGIRSGWWRGGPGRISGFLEGGCWRLWCFVGLSFITCARRALAVMFWVGNCWDGGGGWFGRRAEEVCDRDGWFG